MNTLPAIDQSAFDRPESQLASALNFFRSLLFALTLSLLLGACGKPEPEPAERQDAQPAAAAPGPAAATESAPEAGLSDLFSDTLDDIDLPQAGHFRLTVDGRRFEGAITGQHGMEPICRADTAYHPVNHVQAFQFGQELKLDDGRLLRVQMSRMLSRQEPAWNRMMGHENDQVELTVDGQARSRLLVRRVRPGAAPYRVAETGSANAGPHRLPMVRVRQGERLAATGVGELRALDDHPDALTGPFELAVVCP